MYPNYEGYDPSELPRRKRRGFQQMRVADFARSHHLPRTNYSNNFSCSTPFFSAR